MAIRLRPRDGRDMGGERMGGKAIGDIGNDRGRERGNMRTKGHPTKREEKRDGAGKQRGKGSKIRSIPAGKRWAQRYATRAQAA